MATSSSGRRRPLGGEATSTNRGMSVDAGSVEDGDMDLPSPNDDPVLDGTEALLRDLRACQAAEHAALLIARELPALTGVDWAVYSPVDALPAVDLVDRAHRRLADAALAAGCVFSLGEPPTVAAVPVLAGGSGVGVILIGRAAGLCRPQLRLAAMVAEHSGGILPRAASARAA